MVTTTKHVPMGLGHQNQSKKVAHSTELLGRMLSRNYAFEILIPPSLLICNNKLVKFVEFKICSQNLSSVLINRNVQNSELMSRNGR